MCFFYMNLISSDKNNFLKYINMRSNISSENCSRNILSLVRYLHLITLKFLSVAEALFTSPIKFILQTATCGSDVCKTMEQVAPGPVPPEKHPPNKQSYQNQLCQNSGKYLKVYSNQEKILNQERGTW